jgi:hypothetical protein
MTHISILQSCLIICGKRLFLNGFQLFELITAFENLKFTPGVLKAVKIQIPKNR